MEEVVLICLLIFVVCFIGDGMDLCEVCWVVLVELFLDDLVMVVVLMDIVDFYVV